MSIWRTGHKNEVGNQSEFIADYPTKAYTKIDITSKLQVIQALDNGRCKADVAREYGVHTQTITYIYKQRDSLVKKHKHKFKVLKQVGNLNLEQNLLDWLEQQFVVGNKVTEEQLQNKVQEILKPLSEEFTGIDEWLFSFRMRHNISICATDDDDDEKPKDDWKRFLKGLDSKDIYLGGVCALAHSLDLNSYLDGQEADNYVSLLYIVNTLGTDKKELAVVGKETLENSFIKSLPTSYFYCENTQVNFNVINNYLTKLDNELSLKGKSITLIFNLPDNLVANTFKHIRIVTLELGYVTHILGKIEECFKYHYRRLQISRSLTYGKVNSSYIDIIHMIGNAWYNVPQKYIQALCLPTTQGSLYFNIKDEIDTDHSISQWCRMYNILNIDYCPDTLDKYIYCDKDLPCIDQSEGMEVVEVLSQKEAQPTAGMDAYQAMKRLVCYIQGENAGESIMKYARYLENQLEYGALLQMHQIIASTNDSN